MTARYASYVICTSPRSGSTLLCSLLKATGIAGNPASWFHEPSVTEWQGDFGIASQQSASERDVLQSVFRAAIERGSRGTGVFGLRLQRHSFDFFQRQLALLQPKPESFVARFERVFGKTLFVHLTRPDKVEQAVSYLKAEQTGLWHVAADGSELERIAPHRDPSYDAQEIRAAFEMMTAYDRDWQEFFLREAMDPIRISYDALAASPATTVRDVLDRLGLDSPVAAKIEPGTKKIADEASHDWVARFRAELTAPCQEDDGAVVR